MAYGYATTFDKATSFTIDQLLVPDFNAEAIVLLLNRLKSKNSLFNRFSSTENGLPLDPSTKELFRLEKYLPDIQVALNLAVSTDLSALRFGPQDISEALLPNPSFPSLRALADFAKKELLDLDLAFTADLDVPPLDISSPTVPTIGPDGFSFGNFSVDSTRLFPPAMDLNSIQGFQFDFDVKVKGGDLFLKADFILNVKNVDPIKTASDAAARIGAVLSSASGPFKDVAGSIDSSLTDASEFLNDVADISYLDVELDAAIDFSVEASLANGATFEVSSVIRELSSALKVTLGVNDSRVTAVDPRAIHYKRSDTF